MYMYDVLLVMLFLCSGKDERRVEHHHSSRHESHRSDRAHRSDKRSHRKKEKISRRR